MTAFIFRLSSKIFGNIDFNPTFAIYPIKLIEYLYQINFIINPII